MSAGQPGPGSRAEHRAKRGQITGWSAGAVRRHTRWLYSVDAEALTRNSMLGVALTLTVRTLPAGPADWDRTRRAWTERLRYRGMVRLHWVNEWQQRGVPHLHCAVYFEAGAFESAEAAGEYALIAWLGAAASFEPAIRAQTWVAIDGPIGWLKYLSKHAARGVNHYQRQGKPAGWETTGRLWGKSGEWPQHPLQDVEIDWATFWRLRRLVRAWRVADARQALLKATDDAGRRAARRRLVFARRMLTNGDRKTSTVRGVSDWIPSEVSQLLQAQLMSEGARMIPREPPLTSAGPAD